MQNLKKGLGCHKRSSQTVGAGVMIGTGITGEAEGDAVGLALGDLLGLSEGELEGD